MPDADPPLRTAPHADASSPTRREPPRACSSWTSRVTPRCCSCLDDRHVLRLPDQYAVEHASGLVGEGVRALLGHEAVVV